MDIDLERNENNHGGRRCSERVKKLKEKENPRKFDNKRSSDCKEQIVINKKKKQKLNPSRKEESERIMYNDPVDLPAENKVKETLRVFNEHYLHFTKVEEERCNEAKAQSKAQSTQVEEGRCKKAKAQKKKSVQKGVAGAKVGEKYSKRPDLKALTKMTTTRKTLYPEKRPGNLPGIHVGDQFFSRVEMNVIGLHRHWLKGIDYMTKSEKYKDYNFPLAVSIVLSGQYEDDKDNLNDIFYTGQGGNDLLRNKKQICDQKLEGGNLALKNNIEKSVPVRVIRGHKSQNSYCGKVYTYDGLYKVVDYKKERGDSGFVVFKYHLKRLDGQPPVTTDKVSFGRKTLDGTTEGVVCEDISGGQENIPIIATNTIDKPPVPPTGFKYIKDLKVAKSLKLPTDVIGCKCKGSCTNPDKCSCARLNGSDFPYVSKDGGRLIESKDVVFECGPSCGCGPDCINRTSQRGLKYHLEVFRTEKKGWAVKSLDFIPSGAPICEYTGILTRNEDLNNETQNDFIFEIDCEQTRQGLDGRERRQGDVSILKSTDVNEADKKKTDGEAEFCIEAGKFGNVARFINHSCEPNLFVQCILSKHHDIKLARVMLFASDNIPPMQELTYDYGYPLGSVVDEDGKIKEMPCYCGTAKCRKRLY